MNSKKIRLLLIEDEEFDVHRIERTLRPFQNRVTIKKVVSDGVSALHVLQEKPNQFDVIIMDYQIAGGLMGEELIRKIKAVDPTLQIIVVTKMTINMTDFQFANNLLEAGAMWYCTKYPVDMEEFIYQPTDFILNVFNAYEKRRLELAQQRSTQKLQRTVDDLLERRELIGETPAIQTLREQVQRAAQLNTPVLIQGPSGSGKELVALNIHYRSERRFENFVPVNCGSLPENLIESELFGFEKGAFTGASVEKPGLFEVAHNGTIFLDEITELPLQAQSTLLRVLQDGELDKIGRTKKVKVDVRVISATNKNLLKEVKENRFREDLFYRLNVFTIRVPSLSERKSDLPLLFEHFLDEYSRRLQQPKPEIKPEAWTILKKHSWPGNVRELQNVVQRLLILQQPSITSEQVVNVLGQTLSQSDVKGSQAIMPSWNGEILPLHDMERQFRKKYFEYIRQQAKSDAEAARLLGLAPSNYHRMCKDLGLK